MEIVKLLFERYIAVAIYALLGCVFTQKWQPYLFASSILASPTVKDNLTKWLSDTYPVASYVLILSSGFSTFVWFLFTANQKIEFGNREERQKDYSIIWWILAMIALAGTTASLFVAGADESQVLKQSIIETVFNIRTGEYSESIEQVWEFLGYLINIISFESLNGTESKLLPLLVCYIFDFVLLYWIPTALGTRGLLKGTIPGARIIRKLDFLQPG